MNGTYFKNSNFSETPLANNQTNYERKENEAKALLKLNIGKKAKVHVAYKENNNHTFSGIIEEAENELLILSEPSTGNWNLIFLKDVNYIEFEEKMNY